MTLFTVCATYNWYSGAEIIGGTCLLSFENVLDNNLVLITSDPINVAIIHRTKYGRIVTIYFIW